jgi:maleate cis-trans isomerase
MARVALIHAVTVAVDPVKAAFAEFWPDADTVNILDDSLSVDRARDAELTVTMQNRIGALGDYALSTGCDAVLFTCSAFGGAIEALARRVKAPVLKPNEAMFDDALSRGDRIGMLATFGPSVAGMEAEFEEQRRARGTRATLKTVLVEGALDALKGGDAKTHNELVAAAADRLGEVDAVMLAHFSTSRAFAAVSKGTKKPVLTSPRSAVLALRARLGVST